jgi:hypothetical protein
MEKQRIKISKPLGVQRAEHKTALNGLRRKRLLSFKEFTQQYKEMSRKAQSSQKPQPITEAVDDGAGPGDSLYCHIPANAVNRKQLVDELAFAILRFSKTTDIVVVGVGVESEAD